MKLRRASRSERKSRCVQPRVKTVVEHPAVAAVNRRLRAARVVTLPVAVLGGVHARQVRFAGDADAGERVAEFGGEIFLVQHAEIFRHRAVEFKIAFDGPRRAAVILAVARERLEVAGEREFLVRAGVPCVAVLQIAEARDFQFVGIAQHGDDALELRDVHAMLCEHVAAKRHRFVAVAGNFNHAVGGQFGLGIVRMRVIDRVRQHLEQ